MDSAEAYVIIILESVSQQLDQLEQSPFTSRFFSKLETPIPIEDVFFDEWPLLGIRVLCRTIKYMSIFFLVLEYSYMLPILALLIYFLRRLGFASVRTRKNNSPSWLTLPDPLGYLWVSLQKINSLLCIINTRIGIYIKIWSRSNTT